MAHIETGKRDASLNVVPFIDLMSTLTAFLLVAAVWTNDAASPIEGRARDAAEDSTVIICSGPELSVLVTATGLLVGETRIDEREEIPNIHGEYDWAGLARVLRAKYAQDGDRTDLDLAVESTNAHPIAYQQIIRASDVAMSTGFKDVVLVTPPELRAASVLRTD